jgi:hypothetical protein
MHYPDNGARYLLREEFFNIPVAQVESMVKPDGVSDDVRREPVPLERNTSGDAIAVGL